MSTRIPLLACALILSALALAACGSSGGSDETSEVEAVIKTSATSTDPADCAKTETQQFMEQVSQESGKAAVKQCEKEAEEEEGSESVVVSNVEIDGSSATAEAALTGGGLDGQSVEVELVNEDGQWKMNEVVKFAKLDKSKLVESFKKEFSKPSSELSPKFADCFIEAFEKGSQADIEELLIGGSSKALEEVAKGCS